MTKPPQGADTKPAEFDRFSQSYENHLDTPTLLSIGGASSRAFIELKCDELLRYLRQRGIDSRQATALDAGCGTGIAEEFLAPHFKNIIGVDCSDGMIQEAVRKVIPQTEFMTADAASIPLPDGCVQVLFSSCIFHHADKNQVTALLAEAKRLLAPGGILTIFEHNPWNPLTVYIVRRCPVDAGVELVPATRLRQSVKEAGFQEIETRFIIFFPRSFKPLLPLERFLSWCPAGGQYAISARKPL